MRMWYKTQANNWAWVDKDRYISIQPYLDKNKIKYKVRKYSPKYKHEIVSCLHPLVIFSRCDYYINKLLKQYGVGGLLSMLKQPPRQPMDVQVSVEAKVKHNTKKKADTRHIKSNLKVERSGYQGSIPMDTNSTGVMIVTEKA